jgi:N-acetyl-gamma-glutamyl-phosphate reductase
MKNVGIVGATGYTGEELLRLLVSHNGVQVKFATSEREAGQPLKKVFPNLPPYYKMKFISVQDSLNEDVDLVFLCLHAGESAKWGKRYVEKNIKIIDLGSDFRFTDVKSYDVWYNMQHPTPELLADAVYGLPEWHREKIQKTNIVGNPGCYPTSVSLAVNPFLKAGLLDETTIIVDSKSGVSGAGKNPSKTTHYVEVTESFSPYKPGRAHRHVGEIEQELSLQAGEYRRIIFTPHLTPMTRGILSTIYCQLKEATAEDELFNLLEEKYSLEPFVHVLRDQLPSTRMSFRTNYCFISLKLVKETNTLILFSAIDNLGKGASTQAVQNMNLMLGLPETMGLNA